MKKDNNRSKEEIVDNTKYIKVNLNEEMKKSFISYAMAVNVSRAIPDVRDGLKPVHRRILYSMGEMGNFSDKPFKKSARIVGEVMGKYHPHGDAALYDALVRLAQDFSINEPLVDGQGNFGSIDGDPPAASRYTEARLSKIAGEMLREIDKETVDFYPNYDGTLQQPVVLPSRFPNLLVNGSDGIAVGMATNIPPHNLGEVIDAVVAMLDNPDIDIDELMQYIPAPDFPTKALLLGVGGARQAYRTGRGTVILRARCEIEEDDKKSKIVVTELPYQVNKAKLIEQIAGLVKDKRIEGISDIREESDREGMRIVIDVKRDHSAQVVLNLLYKHTPMQTSFGIIFLALVNGEPKILNLKEMLSIALASIDEVVDIIKKSADKVDASAKLCARFELSEKQATAILEMRLQRLTSLEVYKIEEELSALRITIKDYEDILSSDQRVRDIVKSELLEIKTKYAKPRQTEITIDYSDINIEDLIPREDVVVSMTLSGYVKRQPVSEYHAQRRGGVGVAGHKTKDDDFVRKMMVVNSHDDLLFFTSLGRVYTAKAYMLPEATKNTKGRALINLLQLAPDETVSEIVRFDKSNTNGSLVMATRNGIIKKTSVENFARINKNGKIAINLNEGDSLISVLQLSGKDEIMLTSHNGKCIRFDEKNLRQLGRTSTGVRSMRLDSDDYIVDMCVLNPNKQIMTISENGYGKRNNLDDFRIQSRGGKGIKAGTFNDKTGKLVSVLQVDGTEDVLVMTDSGIVIRFSSSQVSVIGRAASGVKLMRVTEKSGKIVCASVTEHEEEDEPEAEQPETEQLENAASPESEIPEEQNIQPPLDSDTEEE